MDITVKLVNSKNSSFESLNDFDRVAGVFSILTSDAVLSKGRISTTQVNRINASIESIASDEGIPLLTIHDGRVTTESLSDIWGWVVDKISGIGKAIKDKLSALKLWYDRLGLTIKQFQSRVARIYSKLDGVDIDTDRTVTLNVLRYPETLFGESGAVKDRLGDLDRFINSRCNYGLRFIVPYFREAVRSYSLARNIDLKSQRDYEYALENLIESYPDFTDYTPVLKSLVGTYPGYIKLDMKEVPKRASNWVERLSKIGDVSFGIYAPDTVTRNRYRIEAKRERIKVMSSEEILSMCHTLESNFGRISAIDHDEFYCMESAMDELSETIAVIESRVRVYRSVIHESEDTTVIIERQDQSDAERANKLIGLVKELYNENVIYGTISESFDNALTCYIDSYLRFAEESLNI